MARNVLSALDTLLSMGQADDEAEMGFLLSQVAGAQAVGGVTVDQLKHLLGRLVDLTEEFRDAIASGSEFRLRTSQAKWHMACDWVEKGSQILRAITADERADAATHKAAQAIGRAQSALLNMQGMFSRALNQIERQRVHLGQSGLSTTDVKRWLLAHDDLASLAEGAIDRPVVPLFVTPAEMIDVAETELLAERSAVAGPGRPAGRPGRAADRQRRAGDPGRTGRLAGAPVRLRQPGQLPQLLGRRPEIGADPGFAAAGQLRRRLLPRLAAAAAGRRRRSQPAGRHRAAGAPADHLHADRRHGRSWTIRTSPPCRSPPSHLTWKAARPMNDDSQILIARLLTHQTLRRDDKMVKRVLSDELFRAEVDKRLLESGLKLLDNVYADHVTLALHRAVEPKIFGAKDIWQNNNFGLTRDGVALLVVLWAQIILPKRERQETHQNADDDQNDMFGKDKPMPRAEDTSIGISYTALLADFGEKLGKKTRMDMNLGTLSQAGLHRAARRRDPGRPAARPDDGHRRAQGAHHQRRAGRRVQARAAGGGAAAPRRHVAGSRDRRCRDAAAALTKPDADPNADADRHPN